MEPEEAADHCNEDTVSPAEDFAEIRRASHIAESTLWWLAVVDERKSLDLVRKLLATKKSIRKVLR